MQKAVDFDINVVCDIGGYEFVSYSQVGVVHRLVVSVVCDIGGYEFVSYSQDTASLASLRSSCLCYRGI